MLQARRTPSESPSFPVQRPFFPVRPGCVRSPRPISCLHVLFLVSGPRPSPDQSRPAPVHSVRPPSALPKHWSSPFKSSPPSPAPVWHPSTLTLSVLLSGSCLHSAPSPLSFFPWDPCLIFWHFCTPGIAGLCMHSGPLQHTLRLATALHNRFRSHTHTHTIRSCKERRGFSPRLTSSTRWTLKIGGSLFYRSMCMLYAPFCTIFSLGSYL